MNKDWCVFLVCIFALCGCNRTVNEDNQGMYEIKFKSNVRELECVSRAGFVNNDQLQIYIVQRENVNEVALPKVGDIFSMVCDREGGCCFADQNKHYYPDNSIDVYGYCWKGDHGEPSDPIATSVRVEENQSEEMARTQSDFLYVKSDKGHIASDEPIDLEFEHMFTQLQLKIKTSTPETVDLSKISDVKLLDVIVDGTFNIATGELVVGNTKNTIMMAPEAISVVYVLPQLLESGHRLFSFMLADKEYHVITSVGWEHLEKGKIYEYPVELNVFPGMGDKEITVIPTIKDWDTSESPRITVIEEGNTVTAMLTGVSDGVLINKVDLFLSSGDFVREVKGVIVKENKLQFVFPRTTIGGTLQLDKAHFYTVGGEEFDYFFTDKVLVGNDKDEIALSVPKIGDTWAGGTVFIIGKVTGYDDAKSSFITNTDGINAYRGRVVANTSQGESEWCDLRAKGYNLVVGAVDNNNGALNMNVIKDFITDRGESFDLYPAFSMCANLGIEWYYPAINEMKWILDHKGELNVNIEKEEGDLIEDIEYGSSTERGNDRKVDYVRTSGFNSKDTRTEVRAVRAY